MNTQEATFRILRSDTEHLETRRYETYRIKIDNRMTVLDALEDIKHGQDASLTYRRSCRSGICGSCAMRINGLAKLACKTRAITEVERQGEVLVEPMENMPLIRDLVVDMGEFWREIDRATPWLEWNKTLEASTQENQLTDTQQQISGKLADCIMCGCCFSDCVSRVFDKNFTGPASLAKVHRFVADPRDKSGPKRIPALLGLGLWSCTHCYFCWSQCPRDVRPVAAISELRILSLGLGDQSQGSRHVNVFMNSVRTTGMLNETALYLKTMRGAVLRDSGLILKMVTKGRAPPLFPRAIPKIDEVRSLFNLVEGRRGK
jgi:succinate dehydrogenase / fumarate reductase iron-sulfur subunit